MCFVWENLVISQGLPSGTSGKEPACQCRRHKRHRFNLWVREIPWRRAGQPTPVFLPGESHGQRSHIYPNNSASRNSLKPVQRLTDLGVHENVIYNTKKLKKKLHCLKLGIHQIKHMIYPAIKNSYRKRIIWEEVYKILNE